MPSVSDGLTKHLFQDPASTNAAAVNKAITLELAKQIAAVGGDPQDALKSGTFAPGTLGDPTAKGNSCDTTNDPTGCIFTQNLLVEDATAAEISAAVAGAGYALFNQFYDLISTYNSRKAERLPQRRRLGQRRQTPPAPMVIYIICNAFNVH